jgi:hypothetical protein
LVLFFPLRSDAATMLKEDVSDHCHQGVTVKALPGTSLEVVETGVLLLIADAPAHKSIEP